MLALSPVSPVQSHFSNPGPDDLAVLDMLTGPDLPSTLQSNLFVKQKQVRHKRRDAPLDPLLLAATAASGPHVTRHHYHHGFQPKTDGSWAWIEGDIPEDKENRKPVYISQQAPRRERLGLDTKDKAPDSKVQLSQRTSRRLRSASAAAVYPPSTSVSVSRPTATLPPPLEVKCMARTRIPTPHGEAFLHLYHNNRDSKEHLAIVVDPSQLSDDPQSMLTAQIRSKTLDAVWDDNETDRDRLLRGAYVGRLSPSSQSASSAHAGTSSASIDKLPDPLVRIHSECFTGETIGSQRCDCGEQLDEALRRIFEPIVLSPTSTIPGRGAVVYLRQEGRGIGLLSKIRAYNLQDMGHDTVTANLLLGHKADERAYDIATAILRDLGLNGNGSEGAGLRLLTNNPDKVQALQETGVTVSERVSMVPRSWRCRQHDDVEEGGKEISDEAAAAERAGGATMIGSSKTDSPELEKYLRTKIERMGHMLTVPDKQ